MRAERVATSGWYWGAWALMGLYMSTMDLPFMPWWKAVLGDVFQYLCWGVLSLGTLRLARRFPLRGVPAGVRWRNGAVHVLASAGTTALALLLTALAFRFLATLSLPRTYVHKVAADFAYLLKTYFHYCLLTYWAVLGIREALDIQRQAQARELVASQLEAQLAEARLQALRTQLHPHFLFNTLNAVVSLLRRDPASAEQMLVRLGDLLRLALEERDRQEVPLAEELAFLEKYLEIESIRFQGRLGFAFEVRPPDLARARVPGFLLQPLVENALRHGLSDQMDGGRITVRAGKREGGLCVEVEDDGAGLPGGPIREGLGIANTRGRLRGLHGDRQRFELLPRPGGGTIARVQLPLVLEEGTP